MDQTIRRLISHIDSTRLAQLTFDLAQIPSPTRDTERIATWYAEYLSNMGLCPNIRREEPGGPSVVARIQGSAAGPTLTILSHLDHKALDHPPPYQEGGNIIGRGVADPKSGLAAMTEAVRILFEAGIPLRGDLVLVAHSLHEYPEGRREGLDQLLQQGMLGNAIISTSGPSNFVPIVGRGCAVFEFDVRRGGEVMHELHSPREQINPVAESRLVIDRLVRWNEEVSRISWPYIGPESVQVGMIQGGDTHDRIPTTCRLHGTRRFGPGKSEHEIMAELERIRRDIQVRSLAEIDLDVAIIGMGYRIHEQEPIVEALQGAYERVLGQKLPVGGYLDTGDASLTAGVWGIPTVCYGANRDRVDADLEYVSLRDIVRASRIYLATALLYLGFDEKPGAGA